MKPLLNCDLLLCWQVWDSIIHFWPFIYHIKWNTNIYIISKIMQDMEYKSIGIIHVYHVSWLKDNKLCLICGKSKMNPCMGYHILNYIWWDNPPPITKGLKSSKTKMLNYDKCYFNLWITLEFSRHEKKNWFLISRIEHM